MTGAMERACVECAHYYPKLQNYRPYCGSRYCMGDGNKTRDTPNKYMGIVNIQTNEAPYTFYAGPLLQINFVNKRVKFLFCFLFLLDKKKHLSTLSHIFLTLEAFRHI